MTDIKIDNKIKKLYDEIAQLEKNYSVPKENSLLCDICNERKLYVWDNASKDCEVLHFSGYLNGEYNHHIHICKDCIKEKDIKLIKV